MGLTRAKRPVRRAFDGIMRRGLVVTIYPTNTIGVRQLRCRKEYTLPIARVFQWAVEADLAARAAEKREQRRLAAGRPRQVNRGRL